MSNNFNSLAFWVALSGAPQIGPVRFKELIDYFKSPELVWKARIEDVAKVIGEKASWVFDRYRNSIEPDRYLEGIISQGIKVITVVDKDYPRLLLEIYDPPPVIFLKGEIKPEDDLAIAVVGTRKATVYGKEVTRYLVKELVGYGFTIVSGLARGVDSLAHQTALECGGRTLAVLGSGLNRIYPPENHSLAEEIARGGVLLSEFPPNFEPLAGNFPARNRIISGLSRGVVVTEAGEDSGSLITANLALDQNREVFAVPGPIFSKLSKGPADLIKAGAKLVTSVEDIIDEMNITVKDSKSDSILPENAEEDSILKILSSGAKTIDQVIKETKLPTDVVNSTLTLMEIKGKVKNLGNMMFVINR
jgi:DNA processing protein